MNPDDYVDAKFFMFTTDDLCDSGKEIAITERFSEGDGDYELLGKAVISAPIIPVGALPAANRLETQAVAQRYGCKYMVNHITHSGGEHDGQPWILHKYTDAKLVQKNAKSFYVTVPDGSETEVLAAQQEGSGSLYLKTSPNETTEDNLLSLPELSFYLPE